MKMIQQNLKKKSTKILLCNLKLYERVTELETR